MSSALAPPCDAARANSFHGQRPARPGAVLGASILGSSLAFIDGSVVNVALPALDKSLDAGAAGLAWLINAYLLPLSAMILLGGAVGDRFGRRRIFVIGIGIFLAASLGCALAQDLPVMLASRACQGVGAALLMPNSLALLGANFDGPEKGRAIGTWAGVGALAGAIGPVVGGWLVEQVGWRSIFLVNLPVGLAAAWLALAYVPESRDRRDGIRLDLVGALLVTAALGLLTWALTQGAKPGGVTATVMVASLVGAGLMALFVRVELRLGHRAMMPLHLLRDRSFLGVTLLTFFLYAALGGLIVLLPFLLIRGWDYSPVAAGAAMLPVPLLIGLGSRVMGGVASRFGGRWPLGIGALIVALGLALYLRVGTQSRDYWSDVLPATLAVAVGMALCVAPLTTTVISSVDEDHVGAASGFNSAVARIGGLIATALLGFVFARQGSAEALVETAHRAALVGAMAAAVAGVCALLLIRSKAGPATSG